MFKQVSNKTMYALFCALCGLSNMAYAQTYNVFEADTLVHNEDTLLYRVLWPNDFKTTERYPVVLFLHGAGERGNDNQKQLVHGNEFFIENMEEHPAIVVFPQCPTGDFWASNVNVEQDPNGKRIFHFPDNGEPTNALRMASALIDFFLAEPYTDQDRIYIGGLSMGAMGTFELVRRRPETFAAAIAICGGGNTENVNKYATKVPFWIFHGEKDNVVPPELSIKMAEAIKEAGGSVKLTLYQEANHNSWDSAFEEPELLDWLFSQTRTKE